MSLSCRISEFFQEKLLYNEWLLKYHMEPRIQTIYIWGLIQVLEENYVFRLNLRINLNTLC